MRTRSLSFVADAATVSLIERLKSDLVAPTPADVFRKALALTHAACVQGRATDGVVVVRGGRDAGPGVSIDLRG